MPGWGFAVQVVRRGSGIRLAIKSTGFRPKRGSLDVVAFAGTFVAKMSYFKG